MKFKILILLNLIFVINLFSYDRILQILTIKKDQKNNLTKYISMIPKQFQKNIYIDTNSNNEYNMVKIKIKKKEEEKLLKKIFIDSFFVPTITPKAYNYYTKINSKKTTNVLKLNGMNFPLKKEPIKKIKIKVKEAKQYHKIDPKIMDNTIKKFFNKSNNIIINYYKECYNRIDLSKSSEIPINCDMFAFPFKNNLGKFIILGKANQLEIKKLNKKLIKFNSYKKINNNQEKITPKLKKQIKINTNKIYKKEKTSIFKPKKEIYETNYFEKNITVNSNKNVPLNSKKNITVNSNQNLSNSNQNINNEQNNEQLHSFIFPIWKIIIIFFSLLIIGILAYLSYKEKVNKKRLETNKTNINETNIKDNQLIDKTLYLEKEINKIHKKIENLKIDKNEQTDKNLLKKERKEIDKKEQIISSKINEILIDLKNKDK